MCRLLNNYTKYTFLINCKSHHLVIFHTVKMHYKDFLGFSINGTLTFDQVGEKLRVRTCFRCRIDGCVFLNTVHGHNIHSFTSLKNWMVSWRHSLATNTVVVRCTPNRGRKIHLFDKCKHLDKRNCSTVFHLSNYFIYFNRNRDRVFICKNIHQISKQQTM